MPMPFLTRLTLEGLRWLVRLNAHGFRQGGLTGRKVSPASMEGDAIGQERLGSNQRPQRQAHAAARFSRNEVTEMFGMNEVVLSGVLAREGELRYTPEGKAIMLFTLAGASIAVNSHGEARRLPFYLPVKVFGNRAEDLSELERGSGLLVHGALSYSSWQTAAGEKRSRLEVVARLVLETEVGEVVEDGSGGVRALSGINHAVIGGNLTRDPQQRSTGNGTSISGLMLAVNERFKRQGQTVEQTHFVEVNLWGALADEHAQLAKGAGVLVIGRLLNDTWTDRDGQKRSALKLEAVELETIAKKRLPSAGKFLPNLGSSEKPELVAAGGPSRPKPPAVSRR